MLRNAARHAAETVLDMIAKCRSPWREKRTCVFRSMPIAIPLSCRSLFRSDVDHHSADADHGGFLSRSA
jgi:hypothetical protein